MSSILDLVMLVVDQGEPYRAPQAARAVDEDADLAVIAFKQPRCCICKAPASKAPSGSTESTLQICGRKECKAARGIRVRAENAFKAGVASGRRKLQRAVIR